METKLLESKIEALAKMTGMPVGDVGRFCEAVSAFASKNLRDGMLPGVALERGIASYGRYLQAMVKGGRDHESKRNTPEAALYKRVLDRLAPLVWEDLNNS